MLGAVPASVMAQSATQVVTYSVVSSSRVAIGNVSTSVQGASLAPDQSSRTSAMVAGTSYAVATNERNQKITASLDAPLPTTLSLGVVLGAPRGSESKGLTTLSATPTDVVTGITRSDDAALPMTYRWNGSPSATAALRDRVVTYTITAGV